MRVQIRVNVLYFAILRERLGIDGEALDLPAGADVGAARAEIAARHPDIAPLLPRVATAVNQAIVPEAHLLADGDELALIPPVAGGGS
jgi:molybdopterin synthase catalytic subunit